MAKEKANNVADAAAVPGSALVRLVRESGLETAKADLLIAKFGDFQAIAEEYEATARTIVVTDASQTELMARARKGRLYLRQMRLDIESTRKGLKEQSLREGKAIDSVSNALKSLIEPTESYLDAQERFVEIQEELRIKARNAERYTRMTAIGMNSALYDYETMNDTTFDTILEGFFLQKERAAEDAKREAGERQRLADENARLQRINAERENELKEQRERAAKLQAEADAKARAERDADAARLKAEKSAAAAPDKQKLLDLADQIEGFPLPALKHTSAANIVDDVQGLLHKVSKFIRDNAQNL